MNDSVTVSFKIENNSVVVSGGLCDIQATLQAQDDSANLLKN